ncbi:MAG: hypothetical protein ACPG7F_18820, partial [Aggregatilineales bacterium]
MPKHSVGRTTLLIIPLLIMMAISVTMTLPVLVATPSLVVVIVSCVLLFARSCYLSGRVRDGLWTGYSYMAVCTTWVIINPVAAFLVVCAGAAIGIYFMTRRHRQKQSGYYPALNEWVLLVVIMGTGLF